MKGKHATQAGWTGLGLNRRKDEELWGSFQPRHMKHKGRGPGKGKIVCWILTTIPLASHPTVTTLLPHCIILAQDSSCFLPKAGHQYHQTPGHTPNPLRKDTKVDFFKSHWWIWYAARAETLWPKQSIKPGLILFFWVEDYFGHFPSERTLAFPLLWVRWW